MGHTRNITTHMTWWWCGMVCTNICPRDYIRFKKEQEIVVDDDDNSVFIFTKTRHYMHMMSSGNALSILE